MKEKMICRGDLFYYDFGDNSGSVQSGERPVLVVQADDYNQNAPTIIVAAVTSVMAAYLFFEFYVVNYRPVLINGFLEASYPSSTTLLVMCVMPTAVMQLNSRIRNTKMKRAFAFALIAFTAFMVIGRLISGVHWITDIIGGAILSAGLVMIYYSVTTLIARQER